MKNLRIISVLLFIPLGWKLSCSPPRPEENLPFDSSSTADSGGALSSEGGANGLPLVPEVPTSMGGMGGDSPAEDRCGSGPDPHLSFSKKNLLTAVGDCTELRLCEFETTAIILAHRAEDFVDGPSEENFSSLREAFMDSMTHWAVLELFQFGPNASAMKDPEAGRGLRDLIYSWPNVSRCRVEEQLFGRAFQAEGFDDLINVPINARGLFAVEYLSFYEGGDNSCTPFSITNAGDAWANTSAEDILHRKREYLKAVSRDVAGRAVFLRELWSEDGGDFKGRLADASAYSDQQTALNLVAHALLYVEREVKDYKIGVPAGLYENAPLERPELSFSVGGTLVLQKNLEGFRDLFVGCGGEGLGFEDWLISAGHEELAADIVAALKDALEFLADFPDLSAATPGQLSLLHTAIKRLTDLLKTELFGPGSPIGLTLPTAVEGDTD